MQQAALVEALRFAVAVAFEFNDMPRVTTSHGLPYVIHFQAKM
jgi:hypothetical protein